MIAAAVDGKSLPCASVLYGKSTYRTRHLQCRFV